MLFFHSAGVGRTGTLIAIDIALSQASKEKQVDIPKIIVNMRRQRMKMVQTVVRKKLDQELIQWVCVCGGGGGATCTKLLVQVPVRSSDQIMCYRISMPSFTMPCWRR